MANDLARLIVVSAGLGAGCFHPVYDRPACGAHGLCPAGLTCNAESVCVLDDLPPDEGTEAAIRLELLAGSVGGAGNADGVGDTAWFNNPRATAVDSAGNVYVADTRNHVVRKITAAGVVTTFAGTPGVGGRSNGAGAVARFNLPSGIAVDGAGNLYVADTSNSLIRKVTAAGDVTTLAGGTGSGSADGTGSAASFLFPSGVAVDDAGTVYVADTSNDTIRKITPAGVVTTLAGTAGLAGSANGTGAAARFDNPQGLAVDSGGTVYVADTSNDTIRKITPTGVVTTLAGTADMIGNTDGTGAAARFSLPAGVAVDGASNLFVADLANGTIRKVTPGGGVTTLADVLGVAVRFSSPTGVAVDSARNLYVTEGSGVIDKITAAGPARLAGAAALAGNADGTGAAARFRNPQGVAVDVGGNVYVADRDNAGIRKITVAAEVTTLTATEDQTSNPVRFTAPTSVVVDGTRNLYVVDALDRTINKISTSGVATVLNDRGDLSQPLGIAVDGAGNVYIADALDHTVHKLTPAGVMATLAGASRMPGSADGTGAAARFNHPSSVAVDTAGNVYVADQINATIRKITATGVVTTLAGTAGAVGSADGTGAAARFNQPSSVAVDTAGNVYVADQLNATIRKITAAGVTTTVAGTAGVAGVVLGSSPRFSFLRSLAITGDSLVVTDDNAILVLRHGAR